MNSLKFHILGTPASLFTLTKLTFLELFDCNITDTDSADTEDVPIDLTKLMNLQALNTWATYYEKPYPVEVVENLTNLTFFAPCKFSPSFCVFFSRNLFH